MSGSLHRLHERPPDALSSPSGCYLEVIQDTRGVGGRRLPASGSAPGEGPSIRTLTTSTGERIEWPRYAGAGSPKPDFDGDLDYAPLWAGESVGVVNDILPAGEIVRLLSRDAAAALAAAKQST